MNCKIKLKLEDKEFTYFAVQNRHPERVKETNQYDLLEI